MVDNTLWKERHQFVLSANDNIICQRFFKVNGFNPISLQSKEFYDAVMDAVWMIKNDLQSKSRIYMDITMRKKTKLTGFCEDEGLTLEDYTSICDDTKEGEVTLSNGRTINKSYIEFCDAEEEDDAPFIFKFAYLFDDKPMYEVVWDGTVYPKYVRNSVDLSNSNASYKYADPSRMSFSQQMTKQLTEGRKDLIYGIIKLLSNTLSNRMDEEGNPVEQSYTTSEKYGDKFYTFNPYPRDFVKSWSNDLRQKTIKYKRWVEWDLSQAKIDYINKFL